MRRLNRAGWVTAYMGGRAGYNPWRGRNLRMPCRSLPQRSAEQQPSETTELGDDVERTDGRAER